MEGDKVTSSVVVDTLSLFIRVIIEQIWFHFEIYPKESFKVYSFYGFQVHSSRHPGVISYLDKFETELKKLLKTGKLSRIFLEIYNEEKIKYSFGFSFKNSLLFEQLRTDTQFVQFDYSTNTIFSKFILINELKNLLYSIINDYADLEIPTPEKTGNFKILISSIDDLQLSTDENWLLEKYLNKNELDSLQNEQKFKDINLNSFQDIDLGYLNIKSYLAIHR